MLLYFCTEKMHMSENHHERAKRISLWLSTGMALPPR